MSDTNCPRCGAEKYVNAIPQTDMAGNPFPNASEFSCGSTLQTSSDFCREREAHNNTKRERDEAKAELAEWKLLNLWGGTPRIVHEFIKGQQMRIWECQEIEKTCEQLERERDEAMALASWVGNRPIATPCRDSCRDHEIEGWTNKWECAVEMAARAENTVDYLLGILADIRVAVGDKEGKLMQDELVEHCRMLKREYDSSY